jgi:dipeptidyl aminopeptidase/acylaminoacyl peptidase
MFQRFFCASAAALALCAASLPLRLPAEVAPDLEARADDYGEARAAAFADWLADGALLVRTRFGAVEQLHRVVQPLGMREQLSFGRDAVLGASASPTDADRVVLLQARAGERQASLLLRSLSGGPSRRLGDGRLRQSLPLWAGDGQRIAFAAEAHEGGRFEVFLADTRLDAAPKRLAALEEQDLEVLDWSYDDSKLLLRARLSDSESRLLVAEVRTGGLTQLVPTPLPPPAPVRKRLRGRFAAAPPPPVVVQKPSRIGPARFSRDGRGVYFVSTQGGEFSGLHYIDLFTHHVQTIAPQDHADVEALRLSRDGRYLAYTLNEGGYSRLVVHDVAQRADLLLPALPAGSLIRDLGFDASGQRLALSVESARTPRDVHVLVLGEHPTLTRWTRSEAGALDPAAMVPAQAFSFATWDRVGTSYRQVPAFLYRPRTPGPHPVLIDLHGGLGAPFRPGWDPATQFAVNELGYAVIAPDLRGTPGHGQAYIALGEGSLRDDALRDVGALLVWIGLQTDLDRNSILLRTDVAGATLGRAALAMYGDRIKPWAGPQIARQPGFR